MSEYTREQILVRVAAKESLYGADLSYADLTRANLSYADLTRADLSRADLSGASLFGANLRNADLFCANLVGANLWGANLTRANLSRADLSGANLSPIIKIVGLIARATRLVEPYEFFAYQTTDNTCVIVAGCRGPWTVNQFRDHVASSYPDTPKAKETLAILDFIETQFKQGDK